jgi:hypothetical protein
MYLRILIILLPFFICIQLQAQNSSDNKISVKPDSFHTEIKTTDGKIVTVGEPIYPKPLTTTDKVTIFFKAAYEKYPVWCWIAGVFLLLWILRFVRRFLNK